MLRVLVYEIVIKILALRNRKGRSNEFIVVRLFLQEGYESIFHNKYPGSCIFPRYAIHPASHKV